MQDKDTQNPAHLKEIYTSTYRFILKQLSLSFITVIDQEHCVEPMQLVLYLGETG